MTPLFWSIYVPILGGLALLAIASGAIADGMHLWRIRREKRDAERVLRQEVEAARRKQLDAAARIGGRW